MNLLSQHKQLTCVDAGQKIPPKESNMKMAANDTLHCLITCGIGEVVGMLIATSLGISVISSMILEIILGFITGLTFGLILLMRKGISFHRSLRIVLIAEGLSIAVMEAFITLTQVMMPGVSGAGLADNIFWTGMFISLSVGFAAAFPVNYVLAKNGIRHKH